MLSKIAQGLIEQMPGLDVEEAERLADLFVNAVKKFDPEERKAQKVEIRGPRRNLEVAGKKLKAYRDATDSRRVAHSKMTQREVADHLEWSPTKVNNIENGLTAASKADIMALAKLYKLSDAQRDGLFRIRKG